jgi:hypothetical protein
MDEQQNSISALGNRLKQMFEEKEWDQLAEAVGLEQIWFLYAPMSGAEAIALARKTFDAAHELELGLVRIIRSETVGDVSRGTYTCRLGWYDDAQVKQTELDFDLHLGFRADGPVRLAYLGVTRADPFAPSPREEAPAQPAQAIPLITAPPVAAGGSTVMVYVPVLLPAEAAQSLLRNARQEG